MQKHSFSSTLVALCVTTFTGMTPPALASAAESNAAAPNDHKSKHVELVLPSEGSLSIEVVRSPDVLQRVQMTLQAQKLFDSHDFDQLEALGNRLCKEKTTAKNGDWWIDSFIDTLDGSALDDDKPDDTWEKHLIALKAWEEKKPNSILAKTTQVSFWTKYGWKARGSGWANSVTDEGWRLFGERLKKAQAVMEKADSLPQTCPSLYREKLILARGNSWKRDQMEATFSKCIKLFPTYIPAYAYKYAYLMPRWGGEPGECETFFQESADKHGKGIEGDKFYARLIWSIHAFTYDSTFSETELSWSRTKSGFERLLKEDPTSLSVLSEFAKLADLADDKTKSRELFNKIGNRCDASIWGGKDGWQKWRFNEAKQHVFSNKRYSDETNNNNGK